MPNHRKVVLADPTHKLPLPPPHARLFAEGGEMVDVADPFWIALLADGSVTFAEAEATSPAAAPAAPSSPPLALPAPMAPSDLLAEVAALQA